MKRISYSHNPTISQINLISLNLREKFDRTFNTEIDCRAYKCTSNNEITCQIAILPGLDGMSACSIRYFSSWSELLSWYLKVMKEGLPSG